MTGHLRTLGRHRAGLTPATVHPRLWDGPARAEADRLGQAWKGWTILYGTHSRRFYAIAAWPVPKSLVVDSDTPEGLEEQMHQVETSFAWHTLPAPPLSRHGGTRSQAHATVPPVLHNAARKSVGDMRGAGGRSLYPSRPRHPEENV